MADENKSSQTYSKLDKFKRYLKNSMYLSSEEIVMFEQIPSEYFEKILMDNFNGNLSLAKKFLFENYNEIDFKDLKGQLEDIHNYKESVSTILEYIKSGKKIVFVTDIDNDGSLSQSILFEFKKIMPKDSTKNIDIIYSQEINGNAERGFTVDLLEKWADENNLSKDDDFLMLTADNGINSRAEQQKILKSFSKCKMIITDHHMPDEKTVILEDERTLIFNPKYKAIEAFQGDKNISGAHTLSVILEGVYVSEFPKGEDKLEDLHKLNQSLRTLHKLNQISNLLDYVDTDIRHKPLENSVIEEFNSLGALMNTNNSLSKLITADVTKEFFDDILSKIPNLDKDVVIDAMIEVKEQNLLSSKLLKLQFDYNDYSDEEKALLNADSFHKKFTQILVNDERFFHFNDNYIEQLRPHIYHHAVNTSKSSYEAELLNAMKGVYTRIKKSESKLVKELRKGDLMEFVRRDNVTILYPKYPEITKVFNRKFLSLKVYNEENNGFLAMLTSLQDKEIGGYFRGLYPSKDFTNDSEVLGDINLEFRGHPKAAGFFIQNDKGGLTTKSIDRVADYIENRIVKNNKANEITSKFIQIDFVNQKVVQKINRKIKSHVNNVTSIDPLFKLNRSIFFTDKETLKNISINEMLKKNKYGYTTLTLNFEGDTIIVSTELARKLSQNNFKDYLQLKYLNHGAYMAYRTVPIESVKSSNVIKLDSPNRKLQEIFANKFEEEFVSQNRNSIQLTREQLAETELFKRTGNAGDEFDTVEAFVIQIIDNYKLDSYNIVDVEADGLGKAPKMSNYASLDLSIDPNSGETITFDEFEEIKKNPIKKIMFEKKLKNIKYNSEDKTITINRTIKAELIAALFHENDMRLPQSIQNLTFITQAMLNKMGQKPADFDKYLTKKYEGKKVLTQAHNINYDGNVVSVNLPMFKGEIWDKNLSCDSAKFSKDERLAYSDTQVGILCKEFDKTFFFDDDLVDFSLTNVLKTEGDITFPDIRGEYTLKRKNGIVSVLDLRKGTETKLPYTSEELLEKHLVRKDMPLPYLKYSVQKLVDYDGIRSMVLYNTSGKISTIETPDDIKEYDNLFQEYCKGYRFDCSPLNNFKHFHAALIQQGRRGDLEKLNLLDQLDEKGSPIKKRRSKKDLESAPAFLFAEDGAKAFLRANKEIHTKHVTIWEYQKVLDNYDPEKAVPSDDTISSLSYKTGLPKENIASHIKEIYAYKKEMGIGSFKMNEIHQNLFHNLTIEEKTKSKTTKREFYSDVSLESSLTLKRLLNKHYNNYSGDTNYAFKIFKETVEYTSHKNDLRVHLDNFLNRLSINSYSADQFKSYGNRKDSDGNIHLAPTVLNSRDVEVVQFQSKVIPTGTHVLGEIKPDDLSREVIKEAEAIINYNLMREVINHSDDDINYSHVAEALDGKSEEEINEIFIKIEEEHKVSNESLKVLVDQTEGTYRYNNIQLEALFGTVHFSREENEIKRFAEEMWEALTISDIEYVSTDLDYFKEPHTKMYESLLESFIETANNLNYKINEGKIRICKRAIKGLEKTDYNSIEDSFSFTKKKVYKFITEAYPIQRTLLQHQLEKAPENNNQFLYSQICIPSKEDFPVRENELTTKLANAKKVERIEEVKKARNKIEKEKEKKAVKAQKEAEKAQKAAEKEAEKAKKAADKIAKAEAKKNTLKK